MRIELLFIFLLVFVVAVSGCVSEAPPAAPSGGEDVTNVSPPITPEPEVEPEPETPTVRTVTESTCGNGVCERVVVEVKKDVRETVTVNGIEHTIDVKSVNSVIESSVSVDFLERVVTPGETYIVGVDENRVEFEILEFRFVTDPLERTVIFVFPETLGCPQDC